MGNDGVPRDGALTLGDLESRLEHIELASPKCDRLSRYSLKGLSLARARRQAHRMDRGDDARLSAPGLARARQCGAAHCPELTASFGGQGGPKPPDDAA
jgi:hypothetical protein